MNWQLVPQFAITGLLNGGPIALIALGIVLIYKSSEVFNFAQGQLVMLGVDSMSMKGLPPLRQRLMSWAKAMSEANLASGSPDAAWNATRRSRLARTNQSARSCHRTRSPSRAKRVASSA